MNLLAAQKRTCTQHCSGFSRCEWASLHCSSCRGTTLKYVLCAVQLLKNETLKITYSYWDGQGHRRVATVKKGDTVKDFLQKVKEQLIPEFRELRCRASLPPHKQGSLYTLCTLLMHGSAALAPLPQCNKVSRQVRQISLSFCGVTERL